jgi:hypothetical protein
MITVAMAEHVNSKATPRASKISNRWSVTSSVLLNDTSYHSDANDACCLNCKIKPSTEICRPARSDCDIPEYCTGQSPFCPADIHLKNGIPCGNSTTLKCASGQCTSRDSQCQLRGGRMNITQACGYNGNTCQLNCLDPTDNSQCIILTGMFLNGTDCGYGGYCAGGFCTNSSLSK